ncbi:LamG domain-containing protein [Dactylosporangium cerinum]
MVSLTPGRRVLVVAATAAVLTGGSTALATATGASTGYYPVATWSMNEDSGAHTMIDNSGNGQHGTIGSEVITDVGVRGATGYRFTRLQPDRPPTHPRHLVTVADSSALDPGSRDYAVTIRLRTTYQFGNIIQKGQATASGGNFKFQIPNGIVQCLFRGSNGTIIVQASRRINDGWWHVVRCERTGSGVALTIDGRTAARRGGWTGPISNGWPLSIGGKTDCDQRDVGCDYYAGDIDWVEIEAR